MRSTLITFGEAKLIIYKLIKGEEVDLGDENNFIDTGFEKVDITNYEEVLSTKTPW